MTAKKKVYTTCTNCRMCGGKNLSKIWSFGETPLSNIYVKPNQTRFKTPVAPLTVHYCNDCHLLQTLDVVDLKSLFTNYLTFSSVNPTLVAHFNEYAHNLINEFELNKDSLVIDIGSNDGVLLKPLKEGGVGVLGIDPAKKAAKIANDQRLETIASFLTPQIAKKIVASHGKAEVVTVNNTFASIDDIDSFIEAIQELLEPNGVCVFETQYVGDLLKKNLFDTVNHENICHYSILPLMFFFDNHDMEIFDVEYTSVHGGSIRVFIQFKGAQHKKTKRLINIIAKEQRQKLQTTKPYKDLTKRIKENRRSLRELLKKIKKQGKQVVGYGASAKTITLMHVFGLNAKNFEYIVDDDQAMKQGLLMPETHIPIVSSDSLCSNKPDYCLIFAWGSTETIVKNNKKFIKQGGKFITLTPKPKITKF